MTVEEEEEEEAAVILVEEEVVPLKTVEEAQHEQQTSAQEVHWKPEGLLSCPLGQLRWPPPTTRTGRAYTISSFILCLQG